MNRGSPALLLALLALPAVSRAQTYECGSACRTAILDGSRSADGTERAGSATSTLLVLPGACAQQDRIVDVDLDVQLVHPYVGDLELELTHPDGTGVVVLLRPGSGSIAGYCPNDDIDASFDDDDGAAGSDMCRSAIPALRHSLLPFNPLSQLDGKARNGVWTLTVRDHASGNQGVLLGWKLELPCVPDLPDVTLDTTDGLVSERGPDDRAIVTVARGGSTAAALEVAYMVTGSASLADFEPLPGKISIPAGAASAAIEIHAIEDALDERDETIIVSLLATASYERGARDTAFVTLTERSDPPAAVGGQSGSGGERADGRGGSGGQNSGSAGDDAADRPDAGSDQTDDKTDDGCACRIARSRAGEFPLVWFSAGLILLGLRVRQRTKKSRVVNGGLRGIASIWRRWC